LDGKEAATDTDDNGLTLDLHEHLLSGETVNARGFSFKVHFASHAEGSFVDVVGQILVDLVVNFGPVDEEPVLYSALHVFHLQRKAFDLLIFRLASSHQLERNSLGLL
jgi:hypothetical protein